MTRKSKKTSTKKKPPKKAVPHKKSTKKVPARKFALFAVGKEKFCIDLDHITEILDTCEVVPAAHLPDSFAGITKFHGRSVPVVDMRRLLSEEDVDASVRACLLTKVKSSPLGLLVDSDVTIAASRKGKLVALPDCYTKEEAEFLEGIFWHGDSLFGILKPKQMVAELAQWKVKNE
jgi:purine-binding chemotaxis protein CheW